MGAKDKATEPSGPHSVSPVAKEYAKPDNATQSDDVSSGAPDDVANDVTW